jgi:hypothetical protein
MAHRVFTDLDLHEDLPVRVRPKVGEWGGQLVPTSQGKKRIRVLVPILAVAAAAAVIGLGYYVFQIIAEAVGL